MLFNISGYGLTISMIASNTFPVGILLRNFPDDQDAVSFTDMDIADYAVGVNADLITWSKGAAVKVSIGAIADSATDLQLALLLSANRVGPNKLSARDVFQCGIIQGNNNTGGFSNGLIISGPPFNTIQSTGKMKSKIYTFVFESYYAI